MADEVLAKTAVRLPITFSPDGVPTDPDNQTATVTVTRDDGTVLVADSSTDRLDVGVYAYQLDPQTDLDRLTLDWTGTFGGTPQTITTFVDIVGGYYVTLSELRATTNLGNAAKYPTAKLVDARRWFEDLFEQYTSRAFVPRYRKVTVWGDGSDQIMLPDEHIRRLRSVTIGTTVLDADRVATLEVLGSGLVRRPRPDPLVGQYPTVLANGWPLALFGLDQRVTVVYEHGLDEPPEDIRRAARVAIQAELLSDHSGVRELSVQTEVGVVRMSYPGPDRPFGIPMVDARANAWKRGDRDNDNTLTVGSVPIR